jgi:hypothetical protein
MPITLSSHEADGKNMSLSSDELEEAYKDALKHRNMASIAL